MESANKDVQELHRKTETVHKVVHRQKAKKTQKVPNRQTKCCHCYRSNHNAKDCRFKNASCFQCKGKGHIVPACPQKQKKDFKVHNVDEESSDEIEDCLYSMEVDAKRRARSGPIWVNPAINGKVVKMELDTGSGVSVISKRDFQKLFPNKRLLPTKLVLKTYSGEQINPCGIMKCKVTLNEQAEVLDLYVVENENRPLFGREWLKVLKLDWSSIKTLQVDNAEVKVKALKAKYKSVFSKDLGTVKGVKAHLKVKENTTPKFVKARTVPFAMKPKIEKELEKLVDDGVLEKVTHSQWATPIVPVPKPKDDSIRICGDFKVTVNPVLDIDHYPLPRIEEIFASLGKGKKFTKIDLKNAYLQIEVDDDSKEMLTISTHKGLFRYNRLVFGIASAPAIFQRNIEQIMADIPGVQIILDDMIITGETSELHLQTLGRVLQRLEEYNLRVNEGKCEFFKDKVQFCGHEIDSHGLHKTGEKMRAIVDAPEITNVKQLRAFLGIVQYYARFLPNLATILHPLHQLLKKDVKWKWTPKCEDAVKTVKTMITSNLVLMNFDPTIPVILACDASAYGLGAVLSHKLPDGTERPIAFASRTLNSAEQNYSQIDKEATALVWGVKKFHTYLYGNKFTLVTDHKPLLAIFSPRKGLSSTTGARLQRYALFLSGYIYDIQYKSTTSHGNCDSLSRLPLKETEINKLDATEEFLNSLIDKLPVTCSQIASATRKDPVLSKVYEIVSTGSIGVDTSDLELKPYLNRRTELSLHQGCVMWGNRVIIPSSLRNQVMEELHSGHVGIVKMKSLARSYAWWPNLDSELEELTKHCSGCMANRPSPKESPIHPWEFPKKPWSRVHIDFAGPFMGYMYLVLVDAYSKWPIVKIMKKTTAGHTIDVLRAIFADYGVCDELVSDNGPQFVSEEFRHFLRMNGVKQTFSAPYHPRTNGLAEKFVQTLKQALKAAKHDQGTIAIKVSKFLLQYRNAEHATTKESPAKLFLGRSLVTRLDKIKPNLQKRVESEQAKMVRSVNDRQFDIGQSVAVRDYRAGRDKWVSGKIDSKTGPVSYTVEIVPGVTWRRHADQIRASSENVPVTRDVLIPILPITDTPIQVPASASAGVVPAASSPTLPQAPMTATTGTTPDKSPDVVPERRYPVRERRTPVRLDL
ncbi:uncharacterized protein K02A2.6-like [Mya arenaria]|uniref:uncharacterized protein K02A2.6-like n=2 Tax=Mya arenaria TaxID=6604 RepID=UPI0022E689AA|nr:uncharacterized protein K02A2.6-like [Mya arenaria]